MGVGGLFKSARRSGTKFVERFCLCKTAYFANSSFLPIMYSGCVVPQPDCKSHPFAFSATVCESVRFLADPVQPVA